MRLERIQNPKIQVQDWAGGGYRVFGKQGKDIVTRFFTNMNCGFLFLFLNPFSRETPDNRKCGTGKSGQVAN